MTTVTRTTWALASVMVLSASAARADVTESEARRVAQEHSTLSLDDARVDMLELGPSGCYAFTVRDPEGVEHMSLVDRDTGEYRG